LSIFNCCATKYCRERANYKAARSRMCLFLCNIKCKITRDIMMWHKLMPRLHLAVLTTKNKTWRLWKQLSKF